MADTLQTKKVTELTENTAMSDNDLFMVGSAGTASLRRIKWSNIWNTIKTAILGKLVANNLTTTAAGYLLDARQGKALDDKISKLNTDFSNLLEVISEESSITGAVSSQTTWKNIYLDKGTYLITLFLQIKASSAYRNYLTIYAPASDHYGTLPIADIYNAPENFSNMATSVIRVPNNCGLNISYYTPVSSTVAYHIYRIK